MFSSHVLMVKPRWFGPNPQTATDNLFQQSDLAVDQVVMAQEFSNVVEALTHAGVQVSVRDALHLDTPDALFPNNWFSFHPGGPAGRAEKVILYPLAAANRQKERYLPWLSELRPRAEVVDLSARERQGMYLEGTGSLVFDHSARLAYAARSQRTDEALVREVCQLLDYEPVMFDSCFREKPVYHTNVLLHIGPEYAVICGDSLVPSDRERVLATLRSSNRQLIVIAEHQMMGFCGNMLTLQSDRGQALTIMSTTAHRLFGQADLNLILQSAQILVVDIPTIEKVGGGGVRCMIAEI